MSTRAANLDQLERRRMTTVAHEYEQRGYRVIQNPTEQELPAFLSGFRPDIVAFSPEGNVVIEVKSRPTLLSSNDLVNLSSVVESVPGWRIDLVVTNPRKKPVVINLEDVLVLDEIRVRVATSRQLLQEEQSEVAALVAWSAIEAILRRLARRHSLSIDYTPAGTLIRDLVIAGVLDQNIAVALQDGVSARNSIAHGYRSPVPSGSLASNLVAIAERLLNSEVESLAS